MIRYLFPRAERNDPSLRAELQRLSVNGLRVIAAVFVAAPLVWMAIGSTLPFEGSAIGFRPAIGILAVGAAALGLSYWSPVRPHARFLGLVVVYLAVVLDMLGTLEIPLSNAEHGGLVTGCVALGLLIAMAAFPLTPLHVLGVGFLLGATHVGMLVAIGALEEPGVATVLALVFLLMIVLICSGLTAVVYHQRVEAFRARRRAEQALEELQQAQVRVMVSENAASQSRFAAALSHDLNSPLGALTSAFGTIVEVFRRSRARPNDSERLTEAFDRAADAGLQAAERLRQTFDRMKRLTNLDRAEEQVIDLNDLWRDTVSLLSSEYERKATVRLELQPLPGVRCRPQQMSAVFSHLLRNAAAATKEHGKIRVSSRQSDGEIIIEVQDNGIGIPAERLPHLFEPAFQDKDGRVTVGNWGLFITRSIVTEHNGRLEIDSVEGKGTTARIRLPLQSSRAGAIRADLDLAKTDG